jgi:predicted phosphodiesterase
VLGSDRLSPVLGEHPGRPLSLRLEICLSLGKNVLVVLHDHAQMFTTCAQRGSGSVVSFGHTHKQVQRATRLP